jgi:hypothetical protein
VKCEYLQSLPALGSVERVRRWRGIATTSRREHFAECPSHCNKVPVREGTREHLLVHFSLQLRSCPHPN